MSKTDSTSSSDTDTGLSTIEAFFPDLADGANAEDSLTEKVGKSTVPKVVKVLVQALEESHAWKKRALAAEAEAESLRAGQKLRWKVIRAVLVAVILLAVLEMKPELFEKLLNQSLKFVM